MTTTSTGGFWGVAADQQRVKGMDTRITALENAPPPPSPTSAMIQVSDPNRPALQWNIETWPQALDVMYVFGDVDFTIEQMSPLLGAPSGAMGVTLNTPGVYAVNLSVITQVDGENDAFYQLNTIVGYSINSQACYVPGTMGQGNGPYFGCTSIGPTLSYGSTMVLNQASYSIKGMSDKPDLYLNNWGMTITLIQRIDDHLELPT